MSGLLGLISFTPTYVSLSSLIEETVVLTILIQNTVEKLQILKHFE